MADRPLPGKLFQFGYVVPNLDAALAHFNNRLGAPRFMVLREIVVQNGWFRGSTAPINHSMAFGYIDDVQFEIIENISGKSTYSEFLDRVPEGGIAPPWLCGRRLRCLNQGPRGAWLQARTTRNVRRYQIWVLRERRRFRHADRDYLPRCERAGHVRQHQGADVLGGGCFQATIGKADTCCWETQFAAIGNWCQRATKNAGIIACGEDRGGAAFRQASGCTPI